MSAAAHKAIDVKNNVQKGIKTFIKRDINLKKNSM